MQSHALTLYMCFICPYLSPKFDLKKKEFLKKKNIRGDPEADKKIYNCGHLPGSSVIY